VQLKVFDLIELTYRNYSGVRIEAEWRSSVGICRAIPAASVTGKRAMVEPPTSTIPAGARQYASVPMSDALALAGRIFISGVFLLSGIGKITAPVATIGFIASVGLPFPQLGLAIGIVVETVVTVAFLLGYRSRLMAAILVAYCFATAAFFHNAWSNVDQLMHFWKNMTMAGGLMQIIAFGAGRYSLDARRR
jgi:putative oxidoreductase